MTAEEVGYDRNPDSFVMNWETVSPYDIGSMVKLIDGKSMNIL